MNNSTCSKLNIKNSNLKKTHSSQPNLTKSIINNSYTSTTTITTTTTTTAAQTNQNHNQTNQNHNHNNNHNHNHNHNKSKSNLVIKKRPIGLSRNNTSIILNKSITTTSHTKKPPNSNQRRQPKRGAFKGALDPDLNEDLDDQQKLLQPNQLITSTKLKKEEEAWISEPSTRCTTPIPHQIHSSNHLESSTNSSELDLQLPNPLSSSQSLHISTYPIPNSINSDPPPPPPPPEIDSKLNPDESLLPKESFKPHDQHHLDNTTTQVKQLISPEELENQQQSNSPSHHPSSLMKGKGRTLSNFPQKSQSTHRSSINSVRSLSSLALFHNDLMISQYPNRHGLKRVDSVGSVVLPPKVDTTEALIALTSRCTFHPTLNAISDFPSELSNSRSNPPSHSTEQLSRSPIAQSDTKLNPKQAQPQALGSKINNNSTSSEQSECTRRLQRYSNLNGQAHFINLKSANDFSSGLMSSLLSPQLFKSRRAQTPAAPTQPENGSGYFDSLKSFVGMSSLAGESNKSNGSLAGQESGHQPSGATLSAGGSSPQICPQSSKSAVSNGVMMNNSRSQDNKTATNPNQSDRHHLQQLPGGPVRSTTPKPVVPGLITTCGPTPVVSKFLGPRPVPSSLQTENFMSSNMGISRSQGAVEKKLSQVEEAVYPSTTSPSQHTPTNLDGFSHPSRRSGTDSTGSLSRIQKKLLMERDRPISPTLFQQLNDQTTGYGNVNNKLSGPESKTPRSPSLIGGAGGGSGAGQMGSGGGSGGTLPPPSYLIRSLGGQTGPLPLMPLNLLPSTHPSTSLIHVNTNPSDTPTTKNQGKKNSSTTTNLTHDHKETNITSPSHLTSKIETQNQQEEQGTNWTSPPPEAVIINNNNNNNSPNTSKNQESRLNEPALRAKQALSVKLWRNSLIDEVEQILTDHESNTRFRDPLLESFRRISNSNHAFFS